MPKDPAFLFYAKDWLQGTASLMPEEKGVFIDLLAHNHQDGDLPTDTKRLARMVGLSEEKFGEIWLILEPKFQRIGNRLVNRRLTEVLTERSTKSTTNKITGIFASLVRRSGASAEKIAQLKKMFKTEDFLTESTVPLTDRLTVWFENGMKSIGDANGNEDGIENESDNVQTDFKLLGPRMLAVHKKNIPTYLQDQKKDLTSLLKIAYFIWDQSRQSGNMFDFSEEILEAWAAISKVVASDNFYCQKGLNTISNNIQELAQKALHGDKSKTGKGSARQPFSDDKFKTALAGRYREE